MATFVGVLALAVSAYTAWIQRQQVRAQVIPILQFSTSDTPSFRVSIQNKGVGPAIIKHVIVTVDGEPLPTWGAVLAKLLGPGKRSFSESDIGSLIMAPNETVDMLTPYGDDGQPMKPGPPGSAGARFEQGRTHIGLEICYCSTLGDCWMLRDIAHQAETRDEIRRCPARSERTFQQ